MADSTNKPSNVTIDREETAFRIDHKKASDRTDERLTLITILNRLISEIFFPNRNSNYASAPLLRRIKISVAENVPLLRQASENTGRRVLLWARRGSPLRLLLVASVGTIALLTLTGFTVFMIFFFAATINAIVISLLMSLAAAGGFLALFFSCVAAIYIGALMVSVFVISTATFLAVVATLIVTGWVGFFWTVWVASKKSMGMAKKSLYMTGSVLSAYSPRHTGHHHGHHHESHKLG